MRRQSNTRVVRWGEGEGQVLKKVQKDGKTWPKNGPKSRRIGRLICTAFIENTAH